MANDADGYTRLCLDADVVVIRIWTVDCRLSTVDLRENFTGRNSSEGRTGPKFRNSEIALIVFINLAYTNTDTHHARH